MKIAFVATMPPSAYSGGRLTALSFAESLALQEDTQVDFFTNFFPRMALEFRTFSKVNYRIGDLANLPGLDQYAWVVFVPHISNQSLMKNWANRAAGLRRQSVAMLNFETPNWMASLTTEMRDQASWEGWSAIAEHAHLIISLSPIGTKFAASFYTNSRASFNHCYPSINSLVADRSGRVKRAPKRLMWLTRVDRHKGLDFLDYLLTPALSGFEIDIFIGNGRIDASTRARWKRKSVQAGVRLRLRGATSGRAKFREIKRSTLLLFPSRFEGFGIPPLEAAYSGTQVVTSNLPVIREYAADSFLFMDNSEPEELPELVLTAQSRPLSSDQVEHFRRIGNFFRSGQELRKMFDS